MDGTLARQFDIGTFRETLCRYLRDTRALKTGAALPRSDDGRGVAPAARRAA